MFAKQNHGTTAWRGQIVNQIIRQGRERKGRREDSGGGHRTMPHQHSEWGLWFRNPRIRVCLPLLLNSLNTDIPRHPLLRISLRNSGWLRCSTTGHQGRQRRRIGWVGGLGRRPDPRQLRGRQSCRSHWRGTTHLRCRGGSRSRGLTYRRCT